MIEVDGLNDQAVVKVAEENVDDVLRVYPLILFVGLH